MLNFVLFGPPGAGKGTQSEKVKAEYNLAHISTGDLFRKHLKEGTDLGKMAQKYMDEGKLVPDEVVIRMVEEKIKECHNASGVIFDGFPRTVLQTQALDRLLDRYHSPILGVVMLEVPSEELKKRLLNRGKNSARVDDQNEEKISTRIKVYQRETLPVAHYYQRQNKFHSVKGVGSVEEIFQALTNVIDNF